MTYSLRDGRHLLAGLLLAGCGATNESPPVEALLGTHALASVTCWGLDTLNRSVPFVLPAFAGADSSDFDAGTLVVAPDSTFTSDDLVCGVAFHRPSRPIL